MREKFNGILASALAGLVLLAANTASGQVTFTLLETPRGGQAVGFSLSHDGTTMGCVLGDMVYRWTAGSGFVPLGNGGGGLSSAPVSGSGTVVAGVRRPAESEDVPFIVEAGGRAEGIIVRGEDCDDHVSIHPTALDHGGGVVVGWVRHCGREAPFRWSHESGSRLLSREPGGGRAYAVSATGSRVVGASRTREGSPARPSLWQAEGGPEPLLEPEATGEALDISPDGTYVVGRAEHPGHLPRAFVWTAENGATTLGSLSGRRTDTSVATAVSNGGRAVGWSGDELWGTQEAFVWSPETGLVALGTLIARHGVPVPDGFRLTSALEISGDGRVVVGAGRDLAWNQQYWRLDLPADLALPPAPGPSPQAVPRDSLGVGSAGMLHPYPFGKRYPMP